MSEVSIGLLKPEEHEALIELAVTSSQYQASQRQDEIKKVELVASSLRTSIPEMLCRKSTVCFVARETTAQKLVGFLLLDVESLHGGTGERESFVMDIFIEPEYWGGETVQQIVAKAAEYTHCLGLKRMAAEVSVHNQRAYIKALRLGFSLDRLKITAVCGPEGIEPEPEVAEGQSTYSESRKGKKTTSIGLPGTWSEYRTWRVTHPQK